MEEKLISVVIPNYNGERFIERTLRSVLEQTYPHFEIIVVDDASTDASPSIVQAFCEKDSRIRLIRLEKNGGVSNARNTGIREAKGAYIALLDSDDLWTPDKLERQLKLAGEAEIVYCSYDFVDENDQPIKRPFLVKPEATFESMLSTSVISCSTAFIRADILKEHPFDSSFYHEDYVLWMQLLRLPVKARGDEKVLMHYRQVSTSRNIRKGNAAKNRWIAYRKALGLSLPVSLWAFARYAVRGVLKYR
ncbi:MAG: glycosyltransferase family 2 protein [Clostridia bacterium]|nr:glycosyltransferase family 2 protein [Clostridia bacterium]